MNDDGFPLESPPRAAPTLTAFGTSHVGLVRAGNEDTFLVADASRGLRWDTFEAPVTIELGPKGALLVVCDGMGGAAAGEVASKLAVEIVAAGTMAAETPSVGRRARALRLSIEDANARIHARARTSEEERGMGTTCTAAWLAANKLLVAQIGDSRCYLRRGGRLTPLTKDQSLAAELVRTGAMTAGEVSEFAYGSVILQALGVEEHVTVVMSQVDLRRDDMVLVCSDGLTGLVSDGEIERILESQRDLKRGCDHLVDLALDRGAPDNVTIVMGRVEGLPLPLPGPGPGPGDVVAVVPYEFADPIDDSEPFSAA